MAQEIRIALEEGDVYVVPLLIRDLVDTFYVKDADGNEIDVSADIEARLITASRATADLAHFKVYDGILDDLSQTRYDCNEIIELNYKAEVASAVFDASAIAASTLLDFMGKSDLEGDLFSALGAVGQHFANLEEVTSQGFAISLGNAILLHTSTELLIVDNWMTDLGAVSSTTINEAEILEKYSDYTTAMNKATRALDLIRTYIPETFGNAYQDAIDSMRETLLGLLPDIIGEYFTYESTMWSVSESLSNAVKAQRFAEGLANVLIPDNGSGNSYSEALDSGNLTTNIVANYSDYVGADDRYDYYSFSVDKTSKFHLSLDNLDDSVYVYLYKENNGRYSTVASARGAGAEQILSENIADGSYMIKVYAPGRSDTTYDLSYSAVSLPDNGSGENMDSALDTGTLDGTSKSYSDWIGYSADRYDYYKFTLTELSQFDLSLTGLSEGAAVYLYEERYPGRLYTVGYSTERYTADESISSGLQAGTYYIKVQSDVRTDTEYDLSYSATALPENGSGNSTDDALNTGLLDGVSKSYSDWVGYTLDRDDYYQFTLTELSQFSLDLTGLSNDADVYLYEKDYRGRLVQKAYSRSRGTGDESLALGLQAGTYYVKVSAGSRSDTEYDLSYSATALPENGSGNSTDDALDTGVLDGASKSYSDWVGYTLDRDDYYKFTLTELSQFELDVTNLDDDANVYLYEEDYRGRLVQKAYSRSRNTDDESMALGLQAGTYYIKVQAGPRKDTGYDLDFSATALPENGSGNTADDALDIGVLDASSKSYSDWVGSTLDRDDFYEFTLTELSQFELALSDLDNDADVYLYEKDSRGRLVQKAYSKSRGTADESLALGLRAGTYYVKVTAGSRVDTGYDLDMSAVTIPENGSGNYYDQALDLGTMGAEATVSDWVGLVDLQDYYRFYLDGPADIDIQESGSGATFELVDSYGKLIKRDSDISLSGLTGGVYFLRVARSNGDTAYDFTYSATSLSSGGAGTSDVDLAGNAWFSAHDFGVLDGSSASATDWTGYTADRDDYYTFTLTELSEFNLSLTGLSDDANVYLYQAGNNGRMVQLGSSASRLSADESISLGLQAGTYYVKVSAGSRADTAYDLSVSASPLPENGSGNSYADALDMGVLDGAAKSYSDWVGYTLDRDDYYKFTLTELSEFNLSLTGMSADANVYLYKEVNGRLTQVGSSASRNAADESLSFGLQAGTYYVKVMAGSRADTAYDLSVSAEALPENGSGNSTTDALSAGVLDGASKSYSDWVGYTLDRDDYYKFTLTELSEFNLSLTGLSADANVYLYKEVNGRLTQVGYSVSRLAADESLSLGLQAGTYYVKVMAGSRADTGYDLSFSAEALPENGSGNYIYSALSFGNISEDCVSVTDWVGTLDTKDWYSFSVDHISNVNILMDAMSGGADFTLLDSSGRSLSLATVKNGNFNYLQALLQVGTYYVVTSPRSRQNTGYRLTVSAEDTELLPVKYGTGGDDVLTCSGQATYLGGSGDDTFKAVSGCNAYVSGGSGADRYVVSGTNASFTILDGGSSSNDRLVATGMSLNSTYGFFINTSHLYLYDVRSKQSVLLLNWKDSENRLEYFQIKEGTYTYSQMYTMIYTSGISGYNYTVEEAFRVNGQVTLTTADLNNAISEATAKATAFESLAVAGGSTGDDVLVLEYSGLEMRGYAGNDILTEAAGVSGTLQGGVGDDTYRFYIGDNTEMTIEGGYSLGSDVLEIYGDERINSLADDLTITQVGDDTHTLNLTLDGGVSVGTIHLTASDGAPYPVSEIRLYANGKYVDGATLASLG